MRLQPLLQLVPRHDAAGDTFEEGDGGVLLFRRVDPPTAALRSTNSRRHRKPVRLFPSGIGWLRIRCQVSTAASCTNSGYASMPP